MALQLPTSPIPATATATSAAPAPAPATAQPTAPTPSPSSPAPAPPQPKTALYQSYHSQIENLKRLPVPYSDIYHALSSYETLPPVILNARFRRAAADLTNWLETAEMVVFALSMDVGQEGASDKRDVGEMDVIMNRFHPNVDMLVELKERIETRPKLGDSSLSPPADESQAPLTELELQQTTQSIKSSWNSLKVMLDKVKGDLAGTRLRGELLTHIDNVLADIDEICTSIDAYNTERSIMSSDEDNLRPGTSTEHPDAQAKKRSMDTLAQVDARIELLISRIDFLDNRVGSLPIEEAGLGNDSKDALQSRYQQVQCRWDDLKFRRERVSEELKEDRWLEVFEQVAEQVESMMESMERAILHCKGLLDQIKGMVLEKVVPEAPIDREHLYAIFKSFEAKHKYYTPAVNKMLDMLEGGIESRMTRNMDVIQRHQAMNLKWDRLQDGLEHVDRDLDGVERWLDMLDASMRPALPLKKVPERPGSALKRPPQAKVQSKWGAPSPTPPSTFQQRQQQQQQQKQKQQEALAQRGRRPPTSNSLRSPSPSPGRSRTQSPMSGYSQYRPWSPATSNSSLLSANYSPNSLNQYRSLSPSPSRSPTRPWSDRTRPWCPSTKTSSPGIPGIPQEASLATFIPRPVSSIGNHRMESPSGVPHRSESSMSHRSTGSTPSSLRPPSQFKPPFSPAGSISKLSTGVQAASPTPGSSGARKTQLPLPSARTLSVSPTQQRPQSRGYGREGTSPIPSNYASQTASRQPASSLSPPSARRGLASNQFGYSGHEKRGYEGRASPASSRPHHGYMTSGSRPGSSAGSTSSMGRDSYAYHSYDDAPTSPSASSSSSVASSIRQHSPYQQQRQKEQAYKYQSTRDEQLLPDLMGKIDIQLEDVAPYVPVRGDDLDAEFARIVNANPIQMQIRRLGAGKYYFGGKIDEQHSTLIGGKLVLCRLVEYGRIISGEEDSGVSSSGSHSGTEDSLHLSPGRGQLSGSTRHGSLATLKIAAGQSEGKKRLRKVLVRVGGGWQDLDIFLLDHSALANESVVVRSYELAQ